MRLLHTADWHLGRAIGDRRLLDDQAAFCEWLVSTVRSERVELVLIAGDLYDRPVPPVDAVALLGETLRRLVSAGATVVAIAGNHDGPDRLSAFDGLTDAAGVVIRGGSGPCSPVLVNGRDRSLSVVPIPYLDPLLVARPADSQGPRPTHDQLVRAAAAGARSRVSTSSAIVAVAHGFVRGGQPSDSERALAVGSAGRIGTDCFDDFDYAALGHLHRAQAVGESGTIRYSGSPLPYSFSETGTKQVALVDIAGPRRVRVDPIDIPVGRRVATIRGPLDALLGDAAYEPAVPCWVRAELTDTEFDARRRLLARFPHLVEVARVAAPTAWERPRTGSSSGARFAPETVAADFWVDVTGDEPNDDTRRVLADAVQVASNVDLHDGRPEPVAA